MLAPDPWRAAERAAPASHPAGPRSLVEAVARIVREVGEREVMPRFGALTADDVREKAPDDIVTTADRAAEAALTDRLTGLIPGSSVVAEEAVADDPGLLTALEGDDPVWNIDPIDGTHNFAHGIADFAILVALQQRGELVMSCVHAPVTKMTATAVRGGGAYVDGARVRVRSAPAGLAGLQLVTSRARWWSDEQRGGHDALAACVSLAPIRTAGLEYVRMARGRGDAMVSVWDLPWDHAAGILLHAEAGGVTIGADGVPFRPAGPNALPLVSACDPPTARRILAIIERGSARS